MIKTELLIELLARLCEEWSEHYSDQEIRKDPDKVRLLNEAKTAITTGRGQISEEVREFYRGVYQRDVWDSG